MEEKKYKVFYWADFDFKRNYSKQLIKELKKICPEYEIDYQDKIWMLSKDEFDLSVYDIVLLQSTDVTKFSADDSEREAICNRLDEFVDDGKKLIVSHDVLYRRTRNDNLQDMYNYSIKNFARANDVKYYKTSYCKRVRAFNSLQSSFFLSDGELCWGDVTRLGDKKVFFDAIATDPISGNKVIVPTVFGKTYNGGSLIWFNTGDTFEEPPRPISEPDKNFVALLAEMLKLDLYSLDEGLSDGQYILAHLKSCDFSKPYVFISYCEENSARVYEMCLLLDMMGVNYFIDRKNITSTALGSDGWKKCVNDALDNENCASAFVFLSEEFLKSDNCLYEMKLIDERKEKFVPMFMSVSLDNERIIAMINTMQPISDADKIRVYTDVLSIRKKQSSSDLEMNQLVFYCHRDLSQFKDVQLLNTIKQNCCFDGAEKLTDGEYVVSLIERCKEITKL